MQQDPDEPDTQQPDEAPFLERWARRKREASGVGEARPATSAPRDARPSERVLTDADMPPVETLQDGDSVAPFFSPGVSEALRKAALRRVFHGARFNVLDGLEDYDEDFRSFAPLGETLTAELRHRMEVAARGPMSDPGPKEEAPAASDATGRETASPMGQATNDRAGEPREPGDPSGGPAAGAATPSVPATASRDGAHEGDAS